MRSLRLREQTSVLHRNPASKTLRLTLATGAKQPSDSWTDTWPVALRLVHCKVAEAPQDARHDRVQISKAIVNLNSFLNLSRYDLVLT